jgi:DNA-binding NtrC family response regulator
MNCIFYRAQGPGVRSRAGSNELQKARQNWYKVSELYSMSSRYILIIEDEEKLRGLLDQIMATEKFQVLEIADGKTEAMPAPTSFDLASVERSHIQRVLDYTKGNKVEAARLLNIGLTTIYRKMMEYELGQNGKVFSKMKEHPGGS